MSKKKKTYYYVLAILLIFAVFLNIKSHLPYSAIGDNFSMMYIKFGDKFSKAESYELANFYYKAAMKVSKKTHWLDYNIAKNISAFTKSIFIF